MEFWRKRTFSQHVVLLCIVFSGRSPVDCYDGYGEHHHTAPDPAPAAPHPVGKAVKCGTYPLDKELEYEIHSNSTSNHTSASTCLWEFLGDPYCYPSITCSVFYLHDSDLCLEDSLSISDGFADNGLRYCGDHVPQYVISQTTILHVKSTSKNQHSFRCTVTCANLPKPGYQGQISGYEYISYSSGYNPYQNQNNQNQYPVTWLPITPLQRTQCECGTHGPSVNSTSSTTTNSDDDSTILIVGGKPAIPGEYRMIVAMMYGNTNFLRCGGSLMNSRFVLTAAHCCADEMGKPIDPKDYTILINVYSLTMHERYHTIRKKILDVFIHPFYGKTDKPGEFDCCMLGLASSVNLISTKEPFFRTMCLPPRRSYETFAGEIGIIAGWGVTSEQVDQVSDILLEAKVPIITNRLCEERYEGFINITKKMVCAGTKKGGIDTCFGDSGGPLMVKRKDKYLEVGITSFGIGCARAAFPGVYTRTTVVSDWIRMIARKGVWCQELEDFGKYPDTPLPSVAGLYSQKYSTYAGYQPPVSTSQYYTPASSTSALYSPSYSQTSHNYSAPSSTSTGSYTESYAVRAKGSQKRVYNNRRY